jgi:hypothetical protein
MAKRDAPRAFGLQLFHAKLWCQANFCGRGRWERTCRDYIAILRCSNQFQVRTNKSAMNTSITPLIHGSNGTVMAAYGQVGVERDEDQNQDNPAIAEKKHQSGVDELDFALVKKLETRLRLSRVPIIDADRQPIFVSRSNMSLACSSSTLLICSINILVVGSPSPSHRMIS